MLSKPLGLAGASLSLVPVETLCSQKFVCWAIFEAGQQQSQCARPSLSPPICRDIFLYPVCIFPPCGVLHKTTPNFDKSSYCLWHRQPTWLSICYLYCTVPRQLPPAPVCSAIGTAESMSPRLLCGPGEAEGQSMSDLCSQAYTACSWPS